MNTLFIFRRDFRVQDNVGLNYAMTNFKNVIPIFIFTPEQIDKNKNKYFSDHSVQFLCECLEELKEKIGLHIFYGDYMNVIRSIHKDHHLTHIVFNQDYSPYSRKRDKTIEQWCQSEQIDCIMTEDYLLQPIGTFNKKDGSPYVVYTPFKDNIFQNHSVPMPKKRGVKHIKHIDFRSNPYYKEKMDYYVYNKHNLVKGGRKHGLKQLKKSHATYERNKLNTETTHLSSYIKYGCLSIREVYHSFKDDDLKSQLVWREFFYYINYYFPELIDKSKSYQSKYDAIKWVQNKKHLDAWKHGQTGFPVVDACMRQLNHSGYMHNRGRLISANFLNRILGINWRSGELYFAQTLIDYDPCVNNANWQWVSSVGIDTKPYSQRVFNPWLQSKRFDAQCDYIKKWIPELKDVAPKDIHQWDISCKQYNVDYPCPMVDYALCRERSLKMYKL
ncbi:putative deoxyribodipyrimidine photo-lyase [Organic Lake phycodnavirus 1]|nr:putative deoxyribodipyrimidine photo-lyase [Organic Lake phycodnavirus 1]